LKEAKSVSEFAGKKQVDREDVDFSIQAINEKYRFSSSPEEELLKKVFFFFGGLKEK
jgi:hypothetical protein